MDIKEATEPTLGAVDDEATCRDEALERRDWTDEEEAKLVRRLDFIIIPLLITGFFVIQLDRGNIGNALIDFFLQDVGITQFQFNIGQQLLYAGIVLLEIPSNPVLYRLGPQKWITMQVIAWGLVATFQAFQKDVAAYFTTRLLLGLLEAGFIPAGLYTLTTWYKQHETSTRYAAFFIGNMAASASSGIVAYGILRRRGIAGLTGWQWMFLIEGTFTVLTGIVFGLLMPRSPGKPVTILGYQYFDQREASILVNRILLDDPEKKQMRKYVQWGEIKAAFSCWYVYTDLTITFFAMGAASPMGSYGPTVIANYGFGRLEANALSSAGGWAVIFLNLLWRWLADKTKRRGILVLTGVTLWWAFAVFIATLSRLNTQRGK